MGSRTIIVTGAFGVLGSAVARAFAAEGARVALVDVAASAPPSLESEFAGPHATFAGVDLTSFAATRDTFVGIATRLREVDALINVAGGFRWQTVADGDVDGWDAMYSLNLRTAVVGCKAVLPLLLERGRGRIVNVGAGAAGRAAAGMGAYAASKAGVQRLTESLAAELRDRSITVNAILPGTIDTPRNRADMPNADHSRWVPAGEIASVIRFLASDDAGSVTGAAIPVFGRGWS
jgi:NAD(P)-dependent dehydrogenase (short-subunit alcohol dehydrogenase family)